MFQILLLLKIFAFGSQIGQKSCRSDNQTAILPNMAHSSLRGRNDHFKGRNDQRKYVNYTLHLHIQPVNGTKIGIYGLLFVRVHTISHSHS